MQQRRSSTCGGRGGHAAAAVRLQGAHLVTARALLAAPMDEANHSVQASDVKTSE